MITTKDNKVIVSGPAVRYLMPIGLLLTAVWEAVLKPGDAFAGMPIITLSDLASFRLQTISFFLLIYMMTSLAIWKIWNALKTDFPTLPRLTFKRALVLVLLWGLAFDLLLVMIAGTRELMTPEAWERAGVIHKLAPDSAQQLLEARRHKLERLALALREAASRNGGKFPATQSGTKIQEEMWTTLDGKLKYIYVGPSGDGAMRPLAYEPDSYGHQRMVLFTNGAIEILPIEAVQGMLRGTPS